MRNPAFCICKKTKAQILALYSTKHTKPFTIYGRGGHLGHVTSIMSSDFFPLYLKAFLQHLAVIGTVVSEKIQFGFFNVHYIGPRSRNDLDLQ